MRGWIVVGIVFGGTIATYVSNSAECFFLSIGLAVLFCMLDYMAKANELLLEAFCTIEKEDEE